MTSLATIGYELATVESFLTSLREAEIDLGGRRAPDTGAVNQR